MTEVEYGGVGHRTRLRDQEINCCVYGVPHAPVYKGARGGGGRPGRGALRGGVLLPLGVGLLPFLVGVGDREGKGEEEKERGGRPPLP